MPELDLKSDEGLRRACEEVEALMNEDGHAERLRARVALLQDVRATPPEQRSSVKFLERIWFDETLGSMGFGKAEPMSEAIAGEDFRRWFAERVAVDLPARDDRDRRVQALEQMRRALLERAKADVGWRPLLMVNTVLSALFPEELVHLPYQENLFGLLRAMGGHCSENYHVRANSWIRRRLEEALGPPEETVEAIARRQYLPSLLTARVWESEDDNAEEPPDQPERENVRAQAKPFSEVWTRFKALVEKQGLLFHRADVESLHLGLWAKERRHFAVLAGLSGTGKTQLAWNYGRALVGGADGETDRHRVLTVRVQPGWHDPAALLGYSNPLAGGAYQRTEFLDFLIRASGHPAEIHVCVLDEMNLSHPEQYLAPLLSAMEQEDGTVALHRGVAGGSGSGGARGADERELGDECDRADVPESLVYPANLVLIGTVNMDETTMGLSDKVLDRAFTLEFWGVEVAKWPGWAACELGDEGAAEVRAVLSELMAALQPARLHFGWRVINEVVRYLETRVREGCVIDANEALDRVIYAKVLPKLRGDDSPRFETALGECADVLRRRGLKRSATKVGELDEDRETTGSFRFWR